MIAFGAFKGESLTPLSMWRLVVSQWLHVQFFHMLFNCLVIGVVGTALESRALRRATVPLGILGGAVGQFADAMTQPEAFLSGASGASLILVGAALLLLTVRSRGWCIALVGLGVALALDLRVSENGFVKAGHFVPLAIGLLIGALVRRFARAPDGRFA
ncbi:rhomboid family intramembrane serine protease [Sphingomonas sp.]|uniref:rhomboid family intramembrane serine protease n=1 Tax=Sphingomonas sp. TaxID=28214 RepID=UPI0033426A8C